MEPSLDVTETYAEGSVGTDTSDETKRQSAAKDEPTINTIGRFEVKQTLGSGAFGIVYRARDPQLDREVALKVPRPELIDDEGKRERFLREARAAATLRHPNICPVFEVGEADGYHYIVMAYIEGQPLSDLLKSSQKLTQRQASIVIRKLALADAHRNGVVHRDLKPSNIMIEQGRWEPVIMDFGLARRGDAEEARLTLSGQILGTPAYMPPEQARCDLEAIGPVSDIYSLGVVLYEMIAGQRPFEGPVAVVFAQILESNPQPPSTHRPDVDPRLETICLKAMAKLPQDRYASMRDLADALAGYLKSESETAGAKDAKRPAGLPLGRADDRSKAVTDSDEKQLAAFFAANADEAQRPSPLSVRHRRRTARRGVSPAWTSLAGTASTIARHLPPMWTRLAGAVRALPASIAKRNKRFVIVAAVVILTVVAGLLLAGILLRVKTSVGTVVLEIHQPEIFGAEVFVDGEKKITITTPDDNQPVTITVEEGKRTLKVTKGGFETFTKEFSITSGDRKVIDVYLELAPVLPPQSSSPLPGLIPAPARLPGIGRWQAVPVAPTGISSVAWSSDGRLVAFAEAGNVRICNAATLQLVQVLVGHTSRVTSVAWSPDGKQLASGSSDKTVRLWGADGTPGPILKGHTDRVYCVAWSRNGQQIASAGADKTVRVWDADGTAGPVLRGHADEVRCVAWNPDGQRLASGGDDKTVRLWDTHANVGSGPLLVLGGHSGVVNSVAWNRDGTSLASAGADNTVRLWDAGGIAGTVLSAHRGGVLSVAWSPDGQQLASAGGDSTVRLWDADGTPGPVLNARPNKTVNSVAWSPDGKRLVTVSTNQALRLQLWSTDGTPGLLLAGNPNWVRCLAWSPNGNRLASGNRDGSVRLWDADGKPHPVSAGHSGYVSAIAWSPDGKWIASGGGHGGRDNRVLLWHADGTPGPVLKGHTRAIRCLVWSPDGKWLATGSRDDRTVRLWDASGTAGPVFRGYTNGVESLAWSPDGQWLAAGGNNNTVRLWDTDGKPGPVLKGHTRKISCLAWSPDGRQLASGSYDNTVRLWDADGNAGPIFEGHDNFVNSLAWTPDGKWLASAGRPYEGVDNTLRLWNAEGTPGPVLAESKKPTVVAWSPDGKWLAAGGANGPVRLWDADGKSGPTLRGHLTWVDCIAWSPDGTLLASGCTKSTIRLWNTKPTGLQLVIVVLKDGKSVTFSATGELLYGDPAVVEQEIRYLVEKPAGTMEILKPSEFQKRTTGSRKSTARGQ
jgi:WD40 repeat protein/tRNA A-37 threonylcarbamoyl transferase component Bud32